MSSHSDRQPDQLDQALSDVQTSLDELRGVHQSLEPFFEESLDSVETIFGQIGKRAAYETMRNVDMDANQVAATMTGVLSRLDGLSSVDQSVRDQSEQLADINRAIELLQAAMGDVSSQTEAITDSRLSTDDANKLAENVARAVAKNVTEQITAVMTDDVAGRITKSVAGEVTDSVTQSVSESVAGPVAELSQRLAGQEERFAQVAALLREQAERLDAIAQSTSQQADPAELAEMVAATVTDRVAGTVTESIAGAVAGKIAGAVTDGIAGAVSENIAGAVTDKIADVVTDNIAQAVTQSVVSATATSVTDAVNVSVGERLDGIDQTIQTQARELAQAKQTIEQVHSVVEKVADRAETLVAGSGQSDFGPLVETITANLTSSLADTVCQSVIDSISQAAVGGLAESVLGHVDQRMDPLTEQLQSQHERLADVTRSLAALESSIGEVSRHAQTLAKVSPAVDKAAVKATEALASRLEPALAGFDEQRRIAAEQAEHLMMLRDALTAQQRQFDSWREEMFGRLEKLVMAGGGGDDAELARAEVVAVREKMDQLRTQHTAVLEERAGLCAELEALQARAAELSEALDAQTRRRMEGSAGRQQDDQKQFHLLLEAVAARLEDLSGRVEQLSRGKPADGPPAVTQEKDPALDSVMAQFEMLQQDIARRRGGGG